MKDKAANTAVPQVPEDDAVDVTQLFSLRENAIAKEPGSSYCKAWRCVSRLGLANGGLDSLESSPDVTLSRGAFSASSLVTPTRGPLPGSAWFPFATVLGDLSLPPPPHTAAGIPSALLVRGVLPGRHLRPDANQPPPLLPVASQLRRRPTARPTAVARPGPRSSAKPVSSGRPPGSKPYPCNIRTPPASTSAPAPPGSASASPPKPMPA